MREEEELRVISGALKSCIDAHGPITKEWLGSAAKRVRKALSSAQHEARRRERRAEYAGPDVQREE